jgi:hypothetical protein
MLQSWNRLSVLKNCVHSRAINRGLGKNYIIRISTNGSDEKQHQIFIANVAEMNQLGCFLCFVDRASLYNLVNRTNLVHNFL